MQRLELGKIFYPFSTKAHQNYESTKNVQSLDRILISNTSWTQTLSIKY